MKSRLSPIRFLFVLIFMSAVTVAAEMPENSTGIRVLSWNISEYAFVSHPEDFRSVLLRADPDILLLDEVAPTADAAQLQSTLVGLRSGHDEDWQINFGVSGGRQRSVIASRSPLEALPEFSEIIRYPETDLHEILQRWSPEARTKFEKNMDQGIPVNGAVVLADKRRLLLVVTDLRCCGNDPGSWEELQRRVEAREIRRLIRQVLKRIAVDGIILAGDFNLVSTAFPLLLLSGPYAPPHSGLIAAELYHLNGTDTWTWDGRGTPFPSRVLDYQLYSPRALQLRGGFILDTEDFSPEALGAYGLQRETSKRLSEHRPLVVEYAWR